MTGEILKGKISLPKEKRLWSDAESGGLGETGLAAVEGQKDGSVEFECVGHMKEIESA